MKVQILAATMALLFTLSHVSMAEVAVRSHSSTAALSPAHLAKRTENAKVPGDLKEDCDDPDHPDSHPPVASAACSSSVVSQLLALGLLECSNVNILSGPSKLIGRSVEGEWAERNDDKVHDPLLQQMKARMGFNERGLCGTEAAGSLMERGLLECLDADSVLHASNLPLTEQECNPEEVKLAAAVGLLNCTLSGVKPIPRNGVSDKRDLEAVRREENYRQLFERVLVGRTCDSTVASQGIAAGLLDCSAVSILSPEPAKIPEECSTTTAGNLLALGALQCSSVSILSGSPLPPPVGK